MSTSLTLKDKKKLKLLRDQIDSADQAILNALGKRFKAVNQVGVIKRRAKMPLYQKARWDEVVVDRLKKAKKYKVGEGFTRSLLKLIHKEAISIQKKK